jgi:hypothetical protein
MNQENEEWAATQPNTINTNDLNEKATVAYFNVIQAMKAQKIAENAAKKAPSYKANANLSAARAATEAAKKHSAFTAAAASAAIKHEQNRYQRQREADPAVQNLKGQFNNVTEKRKGGRRRSHRRKRTSHHKTHRKLHKRTSHRRKSHHKRKSHKRKTHRRR